MQSSLLVSLLQGPAVIDVHVDVAKLLPAVLIESVGHVDKQVLTGRTRTECRSDQNKSFHLQRYNKLLLHLRKNWIKAPCFFNYRVYYLCKLVLALCSSWDHCHSRHYSGIVPTPTSPSEGSSSVHCQEPGWSQQPRRQKQVQQDSFLEGNKRQEETT